MNSLKKKCIASGLAFCVFLTQVVGLSAQGDDFWKLRKSAKKESAPLLAQMPRLEQDVLTQNLGQAPAIRLSNEKEDLTLKLSDVQAQIAALLPPSLTEWFKSVPSRHADIEEIHLPSEWLAGDPMVIFVQDAHGNYEAQKNIAGIITSLAEMDAARRKSKGASTGPSRLAPLKGEGPSILVGVEGAKGAFNFHPYRTFPDKKINQDVAEHLLKTSLISGIEYAGITAETPPHFWGVEDEDTYLANVKAYKEAMALQPQAKKAVQAIDASLHRLEGILFNTELKEMTRRVELFRRDQSGLMEHLTFLAAPKKTGHRKSLGPTLRRFAEARGLEQSLDFDRVEKERQELTQAIAKKLSSSELDLLHSISLSYKVKKLTYGAFYEHLKALCKAKSIPLGRWPEMDKYVRYVLLAESIEGESLFREMDVLEKESLAALAKTKEEKDLLQLIQDLALVKNLLEFGLTPLERKAYVARKPEIRRIPERLEEVSGGHRLDADFEKLLDPFERFDDLVIARDGVLLKNLLKELGSSFHVAVLVAGAFHSEGIAKLLKEKNMAYAVLSPHIEKIQGTGTEYLDVFNRGKTPLEKIFTGERLNLASPAAAATTPLLGKMGQAVLERVYLVLVISLAVLSGAGGIVEQWTKEGGGRFSSIVKFAYKATVDGVQVTMKTTEEGGKTVVVHVSQGSAERPVTAPENPLEFNIGDRNLQLTQGNPELIDEVFVNLKQALKGVQNFLVVVVVPIIETYFIDWLLQSIAGALGLDPSGVSQLWAVGLTTLVFTAWHMPQDIIELRRENKLSLKAFLPFVVLRLGQGLVLTSALTFLPMTTGPVSRLNAVQSAHMTWNSACVAGLSKVPGLEWARPASPVLNDVHKPSPPDKSFMEVAKEHLEQNPGTVVSVDVNIVSLTNTATGKRGGDAVIAAVERSMNETLREVLAERGLSPDKYRRMKLKARLKKAGIAQARVSGDELFLTLSLPGMAEKEVYDILQRITDRLASVSFRFTRLDRITPQEVQRIESAGGFVSFTDHGPILGVVDDGTDGSSRGLQGFLNNAGVSPRVLRHALGNEAVGQYGHWLCRIHPSVSIGYARQDRPGEDFEDLVRRAEAGAEVSKRIFSIMGGSTAVP
ncbi:MAG: hypothetical protein HY548_03165, partial [Elusimicrobia bacterium]|nr:hypothetical protein [Elusimicrobiota bacterium]